ncbi:hypothetical protein CEXT_776261 [Caerostris extrusa]|uniref:Uncharacterized protein n=1 Tax=Caerostris extrusa TaxID=172846 RepID=A0AAV4N1Z9_CAEEX|nr:hypothetical protein CEXT_776261 [Caerostris extrusa]
MLKSRYLNYFLLNIGGFPQDTYATNRSMLPIDFLCCQSPDTTFSSATPCRAPGRQIWKNIRPNDKPSSSPTSLT